MKSRWEIENLKIVVSQSTSAAQAISALGLKPSGSSHKTLNTLSHMNNITPTISELVLMHPDIKVIFYPKRNDDRSYCEPNKKIIHIGTMANNETNIISTILHEMGHIYNRRRNVLDGERAAWNFAKRYAKKYKLPFNQKLMKSSLAMYIAYDKSLRASLINIQLSKCKLNSIVNTFFKKITRELVLAFVVEKDNAS